MIFQVFAWLSVAVWLAAFLLVVLRFALHLDFPSYYFAWTTLDNGLNGNHIINNNNITNGQDEQASTADRCATDSVVVLNGGLTMQPPTCTSGKQTATTSP